MNKKKLYIGITVAILFLAMPMLAMAQIDGVPGDPDSVPIDGGLSLLVAAGVGYGVKKLKQKRRQQQDMQP